MNVSKLSSQELEQRLANHPDWQLVGDKLRREFRFADFAQAFGFMTEVALAAERLGHHPDWSNTYNRVVIDLTTHDCRGLSARDFELAKAIDELCES